MTRTFIGEKKYLSKQTIASTFVGMLMALPIIFVTGQLPKAAATQGQSSQAQASVADFAKYAYAFDQGVKASAVSMQSSDGAASCSEASVSNSPSSSPAVMGESMSSSPRAFTTTSAPVGGGRGAGMMVSKPHTHASPVSLPSRSHEMMKSMINSYNTYTTMVHNSSSVTNTNSNNNVGSNNMTSTELKLKVEDSKNVMVGVSNNPTSTMVTNTDSFNKDSYNTKTDTSIVNDSFNKETNVAINSGNTETTNVNKTEDSYNTENKTIDSNNSLEVNKETNITNDTEVNNTETKTIDSYNDTNIEIEGAKASDHHEDPNLQAV